MAIIAILAAIAVPELMMRSSIDKSRLRKGEKNWFTLMELLIVVAIIAVLAAGEKKLFTLMELLIVVAIIAILAAIAVPNFLEVKNGSKTRCKKSSDSMVQIKPLLSTTFS